MLFQVFCYKADKYEIIDKAFAKNDFSNYNASDFAYYTTDGSTGKEGFTSAATTIMCMSGDAAILQSINEKKWLDNQWTGKDSILAPLLGKTKFTMDDVQQFTSVTTIGFQLTTLSIFTELDRRRCMRRVYKGAMIQKFGNAVMPHFEIYCPYDPSTIIPSNEVAGLLSNIATKNMNIYSPKVDFADLNFVAGETTESFALMSNLLCNTGGSLSIPGKQVFLLSQEACFESDKSFTAVTLTDDAFKTYQVNAGKWYGCMQVSNSSGTEHETILDGLLYRYADAINANGRYNIVVAKDIRNAPAPDSLTNNFADSIHFAYSFGYALLKCTGNDLTGKKNLTKDFATESLYWLSNIIPAGSTDVDQLDLRMRALDGYRMAINPLYGSPVPLLPAAAYQQEIDAVLNYVDEINKQIRDYQQKIDQRKEEELTIDVGKALNDNIIQSGSLLSGYIQAGLAQQKDLSGYYGSLINKKKAELVQLNTSIDKLQNSLDGQQQNIEAASTEYKEAIKRWEIKKAVDMAIGIVTAIFETAASIAIPSGEIMALKTLGETAQKIKKLLDILNKVYKAYNDTEAGVKGILNAQHALDEMAGIGFAISSNQDWDEMNSNFSTILKNDSINDPDVNIARNNLSNAFTILLIRGKALINAKSSAYQLAADIYNQQRLQQMSGRQEDRLDQLSNKLKPENLPQLDPSTIDLAGLTSSLVYMRSRVLTGLADTFVIKDQVLQYQNLQDATLITQFDILHFKASIAKQSSNTNAALEKLNAVQASVTLPIQLKRNIPSGQLINGSVYLLTILADEHSFIEYVDARVQSVDLSLNGVSATGSGKYTVEVEFDGAPFIDRDTMRNTLSFRTPLRQRTYEYNASTNLPNYTDKGNTWSQDVNPITPFSTWRISIPDTEINKGIRFNNPTVEITLSFVLNARLIDATNGRNLNKNLAAAMFSDPGLGLKNPPALPDILKQMQSRTVVNGWDAVFNFSLDKIQQVINKQYDDQKTKTNYGGKISAESIVKETTHVTVYTKFELQYGYPSLSFLSTDSLSVQMKINIISGSITKGSQYDTNPIDWDPPTNADANAYIMAHLPIGQVSGLVKGVAGNTNTLSVVLDLAVGTFTANNMGVMNDDDHAAFNKALSDYFTNNPVKFIINTLDLTGISTLPDLRPCQFSFKTLVTPVNLNQILQLFIMTNVRAKLDYSQSFLNDIPEPIPIDCDFSLMISSKIFFNNVLPASLNHAGWQVAGVDPSNLKNSWTGKYTLGSLSGNLDLSVLNTSKGTNCYEGFCTDVTSTFYSVPGQTVSLDVAGMRLTPAGNTVQINFEVKNKKQDILEHVEVTENRRIQNSYTNTLVSNYSLSVVASIPITISGSGANQSLSFHIENNNVVPTGQLFTDGSSGCSVDMSTEFTQQLKARIPDQMKAQMNVTFNDISTFALKNLLFTDGAMISIVEANTPGDLLLTGIISGVK